MGSGGGGGGDCRGTLKLSSGCLKEVYDCSDPMKTIHNPGKWDFQGGMLDLPPLSCTMSSGIFFEIRGHNACDASLSSRREGYKGEVGKGVLSVREIGGADPIGVVG